jgi:hypothetical protein
MSFDLKIINGDFVIKNGDLDVVTGQNKLIQDILKICLTTAGANIFQPWYGSFVSKVLIGSTFDTDMTNSITTNQLQNSIENLKKLQQFQASDTLQQVTPDEHIASITKIEVTRNTIDPRLFDVMVKVLSRAFKTTVASFPL